ncbi:uncharacterized protein BDV14DRAFT_167062 [Aspergillus stella-maris]|uniref:uncharacterized protein n=1 Tax=Aspergillus stella-maris TaxID=1810926 RepID=UPI003CCE4D0B
MSRQIFPVAMAIVFGVATGYYSFQPELRNYHLQKAGEGAGVQSPAQQQQQQQAASTSTSASSPSSTSTTTSAPKDTSGK